MNKIQKLALTISVSLAAALTFNCSSDSDSDDGDLFPTGANGSTIVTETFARSTDCSEGTICLIGEEESGHICQEDGTLITGKNINTEIIDYSIANNTLSLSWYHEDGSIKFNGSSNQLEGTWTRTKNKDASCGEHTEKWCVEYDDNWDCLEYETYTYTYCDEGYDITKAVFTATTATFTREVCLIETDPEDFGYRFTGWTVKEIDCNNSELSKGNEKIKINNSIASGNWVAKYTYNNKTCTFTEGGSMSEQQQACKKAASMVNPGDDPWMVQEYYWDNLYEEGYEAFYKCLKDNNFPREFWDDGDDSYGKVLSKRKTAAKR